jgi:hypothetical protein
VAKIQKADEAARRRLFVGLALVLIVTASLTVLFKVQEEALYEWATENRSPEEMLRLFDLMVVGLAVLMPVPLVGLAAYLWSVARRVTESGRTPPPGMAVVRDTPILEGDAAERQARRMRFFAVLLTVAAVVGALLMLNLRWALHRALSRDVPAAGAIPGSPGPRTTPEAAADLYFSPARSATRSSPRSPASPGRSPARSRRAGR